MPYSQDRYVPLSALQQYMSQVKRAPCLTSEEEAFFLRCIRTSENAQLAYARLVEGYQPLIIGLARRFERRCQRMELLDLIQEGNLGLLQALEKYDESKGEASFRTVAFSWIRGCMLAAFWQYEGLLRLPLQKVRAIRVMNEVHARLLSALGREPTIAETAQAMEMEERNVRELMVLREQEVVSLHLPLDEHGETLLEDVIADPTASAFAEDGFSSAEDVLESLTEGERVVVKLRYGFEDGQAYTQREVAGLLGINFSTVVALDRSAKKRLRRALLSVAA